MSRETIKQQINENITSKTEPSSITPGSLGGTLDFIVDGLATTEEVDEATNISNASYYPLPEGVTELPVPPLTPQGQPMEVAWTFLKQGVTYTQSGGAPITGVEGRENKGQWNGTTWSLKDLGELPDSSAKAKDWEAGTYYSEQTAVKDGVLYRVKANVASTTGEPGISNDWEVLANYMPINVDGGLVSFDLFKRNESEYFLDIIPRVNRYYSPTNGEDAISENIMSTQLIPCDVGDSFDITLSTHTAVSQTGIVFFDSNLNFISFQHVGGANYQIVNIITKHKGFFGVNYNKFTMENPFVAIKKNLSGNLNSYNDNYPKVEHLGDYNGDINILGSSLLVSSNPIYGWPAVGTLFFNKISVTNKSLVSWVSVNMLNSGRIRVVSAKKVNNTFFLTGVSKEVFVKAGVRERIYLGDIIVESGEYLAIQCMDTNTLAYQNIGDDSNRIFQGDVNLADTRKGAPLTVEENERGLAFEFGLSSNLSLISQVRDFGNPSGAASLDEYKKLNRGVTFSHNEWAGKKILWVGTSIPRKSNSNYGSYPEFVGSYLNADIENNAVSSSNFCSNGNPLQFTSTNAESGSGDNNVSYEKIVIGKDYDLLVIDYGINDILNFNGTFYTDDIDNTDRGTIIGAFNYVLPLIYADNPNARIIIVSPPCYYEGINLYLTQGNMDKLIEMLERVARKYAIPFINLAIVSQINTITAATRTDDFLHQKNYENPRIAKILANHIMMYA